MIAHAQQDSLSVWRHVKRADRPDRSEQGLRFAWRQMVARHSDGGDVAIGGEIEELLAIVPPRRLRTTPGRDPLLGTWVGEGRNVHLRGSSFVRDVRDGSTIR